VKVAQAARDLGINENALHNWRRQYRQWRAPPNAGKETLTTIDEDRRLRSELALMREERDSPRRATV
jgi:transposase-like protein